MTIELSDKTTKIPYHMYFINDNDLHHGYATDITIVYKYLIIF